MSEQKSNLINLYFWSSSESTYALFMIVVFVLTA